MLSFAKSLFMPSSLAILFIMIGVFLLFFKRLRRYSLWSLLVSGLITLIFSTGTMASMLLSPLEYKYPYIENLDAYPEIKNIVVLTSYAEDDPLIPLSSRVSSSSAYRILEAYRLYKSCKNCKLFISGNETGTRIMKELLITIGVPKNIIYEDGNSLHTYNSAQYFHQQFNNEPFFLVTSAGHMPRAIGVFNKLGLNPIPAPTDFQLPKDFRHALVKPSPQHLYWSDLAVREYGGIAWYKMTNKM